MQVKLDEKGYFTGSYAKIGSIAGGVEVDDLPQEENYIKQLFYKYEDGKWIYDEQKYNVAMAKQKKEADLNELEDEYASVCKELQEAMSLATLRKDNDLVVELQSDFADLQEAYQAQKSEIEGE